MAVLKTGSKNVVVNSKAGGGSIRLQFPKAEQDQHGVYTALAKAAKLASDHANYWGTPEAHRAASFAHSAAFGLADGIIKRWSPEDDKQADHTGMDAKHYEGQLEDHAAHAAYHRRAAAKLQSQIS